MHGNFPSRLYIDELFKPEQVLSYAAQAVLS